MSRLGLLRTYLLNDRLDEYERVINRAIEAGYQLVSIEKFLAADRNGSKYLILRHDVDYVSPATRKMHAIEMRRGVTSSYYFRNISFDPELIRDIKNSGSEASYHFEVLSDYAKARNINSFDELDRFDYLGDCLEILKLDLERIRKLYDVPCHTIASHGDQRNRILGVPNNSITENVECYEELGIKLETYNEEFISGIDEYISDTSIHINHGYRYRLTPFDAINAGHRVILFLTHPNHWYFSVYRRIRGLLISLLYGEKSVDESFKRL